MIDKKNYIPLIITIYLLKVYGSLALNHYGLISDDVWCKIHYVGIALILTMFLFLSKEKTKPLFFSIGLSVFISRLATQLFKDGFEWKFEMPIIIGLSSVFYLIERVWKQRL